MRKFVKEAKLSVAGDEPNAAALDAASATKSRVCPIVCDDDEQLIDGRCVEKARPQKARRARTEREARMPARARSREEPRSSNKLCFGPERNVVVACN